MERIQVNESMFLAGGGEMGERIRNFDWAETPLGPMETWPQSLKTSISLMLNSQHPMWIGWGPKASFLYNDAYIQVLSLAKHPLALGKPAAEVWAEIWNICGPLADKVFHRGEASFVNDVRLFMSRGDFLEETFYSFSYSPIRDESGRVGGLFCPSAEVTAKVLNARRLRALSELAAESLAEKSTEGACASAAAILARNRDDIPFALLYLIDSEGKSAYLEQAVGVPRGRDQVSPQVIDLGQAQCKSGLWPMAEVVNTAQAKSVGLKGLEGLPLGAADQRISDALVLPVISREQERPLGIMVAGINPTRKLDLEYRTFYDLVAGHVATAIQNARASEEEKKRVDMLAELDRAKTTFFSNVSHELRTPLTLILGPLEDEIRASAAPSERLELAHRNGLRLLKLVNTLLDFSRIEAGRIEASFEPTDLAAFTAELAGIFRSGAERAGLNLKVDCPPLPEPIYVDRDMWEKIVFNLLSNALKFTARGEIEVRLTEASPDGVRCACLTVRDTGGGIPESELPRVFERFHRIKNTWARSHEGTGIGLALVQELVQMHGGKVTVESMEGRGTTFRVSIPMGLAHLAKECIGASRLRASTSTGALPYVAEAFQWLPKSDAVTSRLKAADLDEPAALHPEKNGRNENARARAGGPIILADDNNDMRGYVHRLLLEQGYEVIAVEDGLAALEAARERTPALVLSDVMMPRLDGVGLLKELRRDSEMKSIPVILLSARAGEEARIEGVEAGADDYVTKPFSARELLARISTHLELARVRREAKETVLQREEQLRRSEALYRAIGESIDYGVWVCTPEGRNTYASASFLKLLGLTQEQCSNFGWGDALHPEDAEQTMAAWKECVRTGRLWDREHRFRGLDGRWHHILARGVPVRNPQGEVIYWAGINLDISDLKKAEEEISLAHRKLQIVLGSITDGLAVLDKDWRCTYFSEQAGNIIGVKPELLLGQCVWDFFPHARGTKFYEGYHRAVESGQSVHFEEFYPDPINKWIECHCYPSEEGLSVYFRDVSERKNGERALAESEQRLRAIYDGTHEYVGLLSPDGILLEANRSSLSFAQSKREEMVGLPFWQTVWFQFTPGAPAAIKAAIERAARGESVRFEAPITTPSGEARVYDISLEPIRNQDHEVILIVPEGRDITERKRAEDALRLAHAQLADKASQLETIVQQRTLKLRETIGELEAFSYSIAHDMRAPLRSLQGFSEILLAEYAGKLDADGRRFLQRIAASAGRMDKLIQDVLNYSRVVRGESSLEKVDMEQLLHGIVETYPVFEPDKVDIVLQGPFPSVLGNEPMLMQVFSNLMGNAVKFVAPGVKPRVKVWSERGTTQVRFFVQDNGIGIAPDQHEKIFAIFQQVSKEFEGTGIGLAIVKKAIERMGGKIGLQSELDQGTTFWVDVQPAGT
jgi:PAS domain S-box-containing protein